MFFRFLLILALLLLLKEIDMASMYQQAYSKYRQMMSEGGGSSFTSPPDKPAGLGKRNIPNPEEQISKIGSANINVFERFRAVAERNEELREKAFLNQLEKESSRPPERPDDYILRGLYKERPNKYFKDLQKEFPDLSLKNL